MFYIPFVAGRLVEGVLVTLQSWAAGLWQLLSGLLHRGRPALLDAEEQDLSKVKATTRILLKPAALLIQIMIDPSAPSILTTPDIYNRPTRLVHRVPAKMLRRRVREGNRTSRS